MAVVRANYCKKGKTERKIAKANISYIQTRPCRDKQRQSRTLFGPTGAMGRGEAHQCITDAPHGTYFYRLKLSPDPKTEDIKRDLPMQKLTRAMMKRLEKRLKADIPWVAALHDDHTDVRHVHILAALPKRLQQYELEVLIREATALALSQRRFRDRGEQRLPWQEHTPSRPLKSGKYTAHRDQRNHQGAQLGGGGGVSAPQPLAAGAEPLEPAAPSLQVSASAAGSVPHAPSHAASRRRARRPCSGRWPTRPCSRISSPAIRKARRPSPRSPRFSRCRHRRPRAAMSS